MNTPVKFELAKLLKEKGLDIPTQRYYEHALTSKKDSETNDYTGSFGWKKGETNLNSGYFKNNCGMADLSNKNWYMCSAPTISEVWMWLYEKHGVWITSEPCIVHNGITNIYKIFKDNYLDTISRASKGYDSPTEAYEIAIEYTLNNLL